MGHFLVIVLKLPNSFFQRQWCCPSNNLGGESHLSVSIPPLTWSRARFSACNCLAMRREVSWLAASTSYPCWFGVGPVECGDFGLLHCWCLSQADHVVEWNAFGRSAVRWPRSCGLWLLAYGVRCGWRTVGLLCCCLKKMDGIAAVEGTALPAGILRVVKTSVDDLRALLSGRTRLAASDPDWVQEARSSSHVVGCCSCATNYLNSVAFVKREHNFLIFSLTRGGTWTAVLNKYLGVGCRASVLTGLLSTG